MNKWKDLFWAFVFVLLLLGYMASKVDWENVLQPDSPTPVYMNGKIAKTKPLAHVTLEKIPQTVYDSLTSNQKQARYVTGNQKYILVVVFGQHPNKKAFTNELNRLFKEEGFNKYYRKHIIDLGNHWLTSCNRTENCPELWINKHCAKKVCLIHPQQKQAVMDSSEDVTQLKALLEKYKEW